MTIRARSSYYLLSTIVASALSLVTLPLTTRVLGPVDYGVFALGTTIAGIGATLATLGVTYAVASRWQAALRAERTAMVTTVLTLSYAFALAWAFAAVVVFLLARGSIDFLGALPLWGLVLALGGTVLAPAWAVASDVLTVEGRARWFTTVNIVQSVVTATVTLLALFVLHAGVLSLFAGVLAGAVVAFVAGLVVLAPYIRPRLDLGVRRGLAQGSFGLAQIAESAQPFLERIMLSRYVGFFDLGLYTHSQRYRGLAFQASDAVNRAVFPVSLAEAAEPDGRFATTRATWAPVHIAVTAAGLAITALGDRIISLLTNGKFTPAWVFLAPWFVLVLLQLSAKPEVATVYRLGGGRTVARISLVANVTGLVATVALIPVLGTWGAVTAAIVQVLVYRVAVRMPARRLREVPFTDGWVVLGSALLLATFAVKRALEPGLGGSLVLLAAAEAACLVPAAGVLFRTASRVLPGLRPYGA